MKYSENKPLNAYQKANLSDEFRRHRHYSSELLTVPDQSLTIRQILNQSMFGSAPAVSQNCYYDEDEPAVPRYGYDLTDIDTSQSLLNSVHLARLRVKEELNKVKDSENVAPDIEHQGNEME